MSFPNIYAVRAIAGVSLISAFILLSLSTVVFAIRVEDLKTSKFPASKVPQNISDSSIHVRKDEQEYYTYILHLLNTLWIRNRPLFVGSSMLAIMAGLLQTIFSGLVVLSDSKAILLYTKRWVTVHFILVGVLFIIILNTAILSESMVEKRSWAYLTSSLKKYLDVERPSNDYSELYKFLGTGQHLIYISAGTDLGIILVLMGTLLFLMKNQPQDYESCD